jgi:hypothetical protein
MDSGSAIQLGERSVVAADGSFGATLEWPTLLDRALADVGRIIQLDVQLLEAKLAQSLMATADRVIARMLVLYTSVLGASCLLASLIFLLHDWMPWWECFGAVGIAIIVCSLAMCLRMQGMSRPAATKNC